MEKVTVMENKMYEDRKEDAIEIDVLELLFALRKKLWMIILAAVIGCLGAGIYSKVRFIHPLPWCMYYQRKQHSLPWLTCR